MKTEEEKMRCIKLFLDLVRWHQRRALARVYEQRGIYEPVARFKARSEIPTTRDEEFFRPMK